MGGGWLGGWCGSREMEELHVAVGRERRALTDLRDKKSAVEAELARAGEEAR